MITSFLDVPGGRLAYSDVGSGPLVIAVPGVGDLRSTYRFLTPRLVAAGYRVISLDLRGLGESSVSWGAYAVGDVAADILALATSLNAGPAHIIGNSMAAGAAVIAAARKPEVVSSLTLVGPFVRDMMPPWVTSALFGPLMFGLWGPVVWRMLYKRSFPTRLPDDFDAEVGRRNANLAEAGRFAATRNMFLASKAEAERCTPDVTAPVLVLMGSRDTDFPNPAKEAQNVAELVHGRLFMIEGAGHYPQAEMPDAVAAQVIPFFKSVDARNAGQHAS